MHHVPVGGMAYSHKVCLLLQLTEILADYLLGSVGIGKYFIGSFGAKWPYLAQVLHASHVLDGLSQS